LVDKAHSRASQQETKDPPQIIEAIIISNLSLKNRDPLVARENIKAEIVHLQFIRRMFHPEGKYMRLNLKSMWQTKKTRELWRKN
jgi:hypothetical protein